MNSENSQKIMHAITPFLDNEYITSSYLEGGFTEKILSSHHFSDTAIDCYSKYYSFLHMINEGIDVIKSPHSNKKLKIGKELIQALEFFKTNKNIKDYFDKHGSSPAKQNLLLSLIENKFIFDVTVNQDKLFNLKYVEIDINTVCNQSCVYCPVSLEPRKKHEMSEELFDKILDQIASINSSDTVVFLTSYNEATLDKRYPKFVKRIKDKGLNHIVISNGSNLSPKLVDELISTDINEFILNVPALDEEEYYKLRGTRDLKKIITNIDYIASKNVKISVIVHGVGDLKHYKNFSDLKRRFAKLGVIVSMGKTMDRGGIMKNEYRTSVKRKKTFGCMNNSSRLINWVHINSEGLCFICSMDYYYRYTLGNLKDSTLEDVLSGEKISHYRRLAYGLEESTDDFICKNCIASIPSSWKEITRADMETYSYKKNYYKVILKKKIKSLSFHTPLYLREKASSLFSK